MLPFTMTVQTIMTIHAIIIVSITICRMLFAHSENLSSILVLIAGLSGKLHCLHCSTHRKSVTWNSPKDLGISLEGFEAIYKQIVMSLKKSLNSTLDIFEEVNIMLPLEPSRRR